MTSRPVVRLLDRTTPPHILTLVLMAGLGAMNMSAFLPALPAMTRDFGTDYSVMQLAVSLYLATTAVVQLAIGPVSDTYGRRPVAMWSIVIFIVATLGCMMAPNVQIFLVFRMLQASVAVGLVLSRAIVRDMVPVAESASMIGYVTMGMALVPMVAPMIGGALDEIAGWHSIFVFLAAVGAVVLVLCWFDQGETVSAEGRSFSEQLRDYPELLTSPRFWGYCLAAAFASGSFFAYLGGAPYIASEVYGLSAFSAGVGFGAPAIGYFFGNYLSGRHSVRLGLNWMVKTGSIVLVLGLTVSTLVTLLGLDTALVFFALFTAVGVGNGMIIPNASAGMLSVRPQLAGSASGLGSAIMIGGGAVLSVLSGAALRLGGGALPLVVIMLGSSVLALASILYVIRREERLVAV